MADPPYVPLLTSFELVGALTAQEIRAVGLRSEERPAVKRGTLWYLNEKLFGKGVGADDPFDRNRNDGGFEPIRKNLSYQRVVPAAVITNQSTALPEEEEDENGMGRGKRKRRASSAAKASIEDVVPTLPITIHYDPKPVYIPVPSTHRRSSSGSVSAPTKLATPRLRLRLTNLEEVDSMDDSDAGSDVQARRTTKKKSRRAASEGGITIGMARIGSQQWTDDVDDDEVDRVRQSTFSSASSSALLAQSLLAVSGPTPLASTSPVDKQTNISPRSLSLSFLPSRGSIAQLSVSAPIFSSFPPLDSPDMMDVDSRARSETLVDSADEDDFHEAMLRGEDFDFEWSSESYTATTATSLSQKATSKATERESSVLSVSEMEAFDVKPEIDDDSSTPATTPRSPVPEEDLEGSVGSLKFGMEATLCEAFEEEEMESVDEKSILKVTSSSSSLFSSRVGTDWIYSVNRVESTESLRSLVHEEEETSDPPSSLSRQLADPTILNVQLPSPLNLDLPPMIAMGRSYSPDYDFVGLAEDDRSAYRNPYDRADSVDEEEEDDIITVKIEDDESVGLNSAHSSRASSAYPVDAFATRLQVRNDSSSASDLHGAFEIVSNSILASGLPVPQAAPSPPEEAEWSMHIEGDELELELSNAENILGPESVGMLELDLAWGGSIEKGRNESVEQWRGRIEGREATQEISSHRTFLTRSPVELLFAPPPSVPAICPEQMMNLPPLPKEEEEEVIQERASSPVIEPTSPIITKRSQRAGRGQRKGSMSGVDFSAERERERETSLEFELEFEMDEEEAAVVVKSTGRRGRRAKVPV